MPDHRQRIAAVSAFSFACLALLCLPFALSSAMAGPPPAESYEQLAAVPGDYRGSTASPLDGADSLDWSKPLDRTKTLIETRGNPTLYVRADLSVTGQTVDVYCGLWLKQGAKFTFLGVAGKQTATSGAGTRASGRYVADSVLIFDTGCATHVELRKGDPSGGATVTLLPWLGGSDPGGA